MYKFNGFTLKANNAINYAIIIAEQLGHTYVGSEHMLMGLIREGTGVAAGILKQKNVSYDRVMQNVEQKIGRGVLSVLSPSDFTKNLVSLLERSAIECRTLGFVLSGTEHILIACATQEGSFAMQILREVGLDKNLMLKMINDVVSGETLEQERQKKMYGAPPIPPPPQNIPKTNKNGARTVTLDKFGRDLNELAITGRLDPVIGRDKEIDRVIQILTRRTKNNPCLIGETGVGKTAIVEGLAQRIVLGQVPEMLIDCRIVCIDLTAMVSGTKYRGDFEERIRLMMEEVQQAENIILFIDEIHTIMGVGAAEGAVDAANMMKPQLARGGFKVIGATTTAEYKKTIERDGALERRFQSILVEEPDVPTTICIIQGLRDRYERHHQVTIADEAIEAAVELSKRYDIGRFLPDKAIDLIDEASAKMRIKNIGKSRKNLILTREHIAEIIAETTGIDMSRLTEEETKRFTQLEAELKEKVVGQDEAIAKVCRSIRRSRAGLKDPLRPIGSFMLIGPTGVGKSQLCRALAEVLFGDRESIIKLDMSEYMERHSVSRLIGSPPGYLGYDEGGQLTDKIRRKPYSIVLFDEIEKAHPDVFNILLQILEDGVLTDNHGRRAEFRNAIIMLTTNAGSALGTAKSSVGFGSDGDTLAKSAARVVLQRVRETFSPEMLNRLDDLVVFQRLGNEELCKIAELELFKVQERLRDMSIEMKYTDALVAAMASDSDTAIYGARPIRRAVESKVEDAIADAILLGDVHEGDRISCDFLDGKLCLTNISPAVAI